MKDQPNSGIGETMIDTKELVARLEKVEKQNRRMKVVGGAVVVLVIMIVWALSYSPVINAEQINLEDSSGRRMATLGMKDGEAILFFYDENGTRRATLGMFESHPHLALADEQGNLRTMFISAEGTPVLNIYGEEGDIRAAIGDCNHWFSPEKNDTFSRECSLLFVDDKGKIIFEAPEQK